MKQVFLSTTTEFKEIDTLEPGTWINLVNPTQNESLEIANAFDIDIADLRAPLDAEEMSRITIEDEYTLIIVDVPITEERNNRTYYVTIPLGIIITEETIITTCLEALPVLDVFINRRLRNFYTFMRSRFIFQILYRNAELYLTALRSIDRKSEQIESQLHKSTRNEELIELMELEKTIVYFKAAWNPSQFSMSLSTVDCVTFTPSCVHALSSRFSTATPNFTLRPFVRSTVRVNKSKVNFTSLLETKS